MIIEVAAAVGLGAALLALAARRRRSRSSGEDSASTIPPRPASNVPNQNEARALRVGDVVAAEGGDHWLVGAYRLDDDGQRTLLLSSSEGSFFLEHEASTGSIALLESTDCVPAGTVPDRLPVGPLGLTLRQRSFARATIEGSFAHACAGPCELVLLGDAAGRILLVLDHQGGRLALLGRRLDRHEYDTLPGTEAAAADDTSQEPGLDAKP